MKRILLIGDFHIPSRASWVPDWMVDLLDSKKFDLVLCTGDLESEDVLGWLENFGRVYCVQGNMDWLDLPDHEIVEVGKFRIGLMHGKGIHPRGDLKQLDWYAEKMGCQILVHGHTHRLGIDVYNKRLFVNPGSATGVWGGSSTGGPQSFVVMVIEGSNVDLHIFIDGKEKVERYEYKDGFSRVG